MHKELVDASGNGSGDAVSRLRAQHQEADARLKELARQLSLSPEEQLEISRLKKHKLHLKDEMRALMPNPT